MGKRKTLDADGNWYPKKIKIEYTNEKPTASAGLVPLVDVFVGSTSYKKLKEKKRSKLR